jgi:hypothetical protein
MRRILSGINERKVLMVKARQGFAVGTGDVHINIFIRADSKIL